MEELIVTVVGIGLVFGLLYISGLWNKEYIIDVSISEPIEDRTNKTYTAEELMVVTNYDLTSEEVASKLGRTVKAIQAKRWSLNRQSNKGVINE
jgi:hypothetical protein